MNNERKKLTSVGWMRIIESVMYISLIAAMTVFAGLVLLSEALNIATIAAFVILAVVAAVVASTLGLNIKSILAETRQ